MVDVFQVANAMAMTSTCCKCKEGGVVVDTATGNVVSVCRSRCTHGYSSCAHKYARDCPCFVSAYGDLVVQGTEKLKGTQIYVVSESYPTPVDGSELTRYLSLCGADVISFNKLGATLSNKSKELNVPRSECCEHDTTKKESMDLLRVTLTELRRVRRAARRLLKLLLVKNTATHGGSESVTCVTKCFSTSAAQRTLASQGRAVARSV